MKNYFEVNSPEELEKLISKAFETELVKSDSKKRELKEELLTTQELCDFLKLSRTSVWALGKTGILPFIRVGNQKRYLKSEVLKKLTEFKSEGI